jgi:hypothetical protein
LIRLSVDAAIVGVVVRCSIIALKSASKTVLCATPYGFCVLIRVVSLVNLLNDMDNFRRQMAFLFQRPQNMSFYHRVADTVTFTPNGVTAFKGCPDGWVTIHLTLLCIGTR